MMNNSPEVLAPVGSPETLVAAVRSGADAVYLGAKDFSARRNAVNFTVEEIKTAAEYCHIRGVRVYLTLNIMLRENELESALNLVKSAAKAGIDGIIVQDLGLAKLIHLTVPDLPIHASTQMTVHSPSALLPLKKLGISRVVVSRELSLKAIAEICEEAKRLSMTVEVFVHGALCMSVSGQCLLSAILGGRSGNRGLCAGPCRLPFKAPKGNGYDLSLKDLSLFKHIDELKSIGVASLKIEGRMKRPEYVAAATAACRAACDNGYVPDELSVTLKNVFSRSGFTDGYLTEKLGIDMFGIRTKDDVVSANSAFSALHPLYRNELQRIKLTATAEIKTGQPIAITLSDGTNTVCAKGEIPTPAQNRPITADNIINALSKSGGTPYSIDVDKTHIDNNLYVSAADLNTLRRTALQLLDEKRAYFPPYKINETKFDEFDIKSSTNAPYIVARFDKSEQIPVNLKGIKAIMLPIEEEIPDNLPDDIELIADVPRGIIDEEYILNRLNLFASKGFKYGYCGNIAVIPLINKAGLEVFGGTGLNVANSNTVNVLSELGAKAITLSPELTLNECINLKSKIKKGIFAYGRLPLMLMRNCPIKNGMTCKECGRRQSLTDRMGIEFPIRCRSGFSELLNSQPIWLADRLDELTGLDFIILYFTDETSEDISKIIDMYKFGGTYNGKFTRGLYYRNIQ